MSPPDEDDDIPTFQDLVDEVVGSTRRTEAGAAAEARTDEAVGDEERVAVDEPTSGDDASSWEWVGDDEEGTTAPAPEPGDEAATSAGAEEEDRPPDRLAGSQFSPPPDDGSGSSNVLVLGPPKTATEYELCAKLCGVVGDRRRRILVVTGQPPDERLQELRQFDEEPFDETTIIVLGEHGPTKPGEPPTTYQIDGETVTVELVRDPLDYTRLGLLINKHLPDRADEPAPAICVHSLTPLIELDGPGKLVSFLSVLHGQAEYAGAPVHYHLDPEEVSETNVSDLERIVGAAVRYDADGDVSVDM